LELTLLLANVAQALGDRPMRLEFRPELQQWGLTWIRKGRAIVGGSAWYPEHISESLELALEHVLLVEHLNTPAPKQHA
jgi:hypothetical protein